jgi:spore germination protein YaaH
MYGTVFAPTRRAIRGDEYVKMLEQYEPTLDWDAESEEQFWEFSDEEAGLIDGEVWFPSLYSIKYVPFETN